MYLHNHIELIQPTTMFTRSKGMAPILYPEEREPLGSIAPVTPFTKPHVDPSCAVRITLSCIMQLYNAVGYTPRAMKKNAIGITGFLGQNANKQDLSGFYRDQLPAAVNSTFKSISVYGIAFSRVVYLVCAHMIAGGINNQSLAAAGEEANLDTQFAFGISHPTPGTFWSTPGLPPWLQDEHTAAGKLFHSVNYVRANIISLQRHERALPRCACKSILWQTSLTSCIVARFHSPVRPYTANDIDLVRRRRTNGLVGRRLVSWSAHISRSAIHICEPRLQTFRRTRWVNSPPDNLPGLTQELGVRGVSVLFASGDGGVGDGNADPATQQCRTNDKKRTRRYFSLHPPNQPLNAISTSDFSRHFPRTYPASMNAQT
jgi:hypothetical protein